MSTDRPVRRAVVLFNLGGPDSPAAVRPFLFNLFNDPAIIGAPPLVRRLLATFIAWRRAPVAREIYARIGGCSPLRAETEAQAAALAAALNGDTVALPAGPDEHGETRVFIAMRYWHPLIADTVAAVKQFAPDEVVLLPLYPQFSTTTTASSWTAWRAAAAAVGLTAPVRAICCYPTADFFVDAHARGIADMLDTMPDGPDVRVLFSAHGLPERIVATGDPYSWQVEQTVAAVVKRLDRPGLDWVTAYQSRVGPLAWIKPATDAEIRRAGQEGKALVVVPIAFVSEHSETLVELDIEYAALARDSGVPTYRRVPTLSVDAGFIAGLAGLALRPPAGMPWDIQAESGGRLCWPDLSQCPCRQEEAR